MRRSRLAPAAVGLVAGIAATFAAPGVASAETVIAPKNVATLLCLDSNTSGSVYTLKCNTGFYQEWIEALGTYGKVYRNLATGMCLDSNAERSVYTHVCNGGSYQQWNLANNGGSSYTLRNVATGYCLDSDTTGHVYTLDCNGGNFQAWYRY